MTQEEQAGSIYAVSHEGHATLIAALRWYQKSGMGDPDNRDDGIHDLATDGGVLISLDSDGVDELVSTLQFGDMAESISTLRAQHARLLAALQAVHEAARMSDHDRVKYIAAIAAKGIREAGATTLVEQAAISNPLSGAGALVLAATRTPEKMSDMARTMLGKDDAAPGGGDAPSPARPRMPA
ncbi:hypothetical protein [Paraburkholderia hospita]|uniref:hypothetical protein n=1 Tax=Paraburkholderia hospita TaxID=169430 RepID=UPI0008A810ED|nr:hypothetical protein [Paraburkholderia hospita]SEI14570.1 hypothetical protein SAMN05192544_102565 [Paraburkholderia hospita]